jgi:hypothetical protein
VSKTPEELLRELESSGVLSGSSTPVAPQRSSSASIPAARPANEDRLSLVYLVGAAILVAVLGALPIGQVALYPFSLFVTTIHEVCHGIAAVATGGSVVNLSVSTDLSGLTETTGGSLPLIASAGYVGASIVGALTILTPARAARAVLAVLALFPAAALMFFHPASLFTSVSSGLFVIALLLAAWKMPARFLAPLQMFLGVEIGLNALRDLLTLIFIEGSSAHIQTDADLMSTSLFGRSLMWAGLWAALSAVIVLLAIARLVSRARRHSP